MIYHCSAVHAVWHALVVQKSSSIIYPYRRSASAPLFSCFSDVWHNIEILYRYGQVSVHFVVANYIYQCVFALVEHKCSACIHLGMTKSGFLLRVSAVLPESARSVHRKKPRKEPDSIKNNNMICAHRYHVQLHQKHKRQHDLRLSLQLFLLKQSQSQEAT